MKTKQLQEYLINKGVEIGLSIRGAVNKIPFEERGKKVFSKIKPDQYSRHADLIGEEIGIQKLEKISEDLQL